MSNRRLFRNSKLPYHLQERVDADLLPNEKLLWVGQPDPRRAVYSSLLVVACALPFICFALAWMVAAWTLTRRSEWLGLAFVLLGAPFLLIGCAFLSAPYWAWRWAKHSFYALTDSRAIAWNAKWVGALERRSFTADEIRSLDTISYADGVGDLIFSKQVFYRYNSRGRRTRREKRDGFLGIPDHHAVERLIRKVFLPVQNE